MRVTRYNDEKIVAGLCACDARVTKDHYYRYCRRAYDIFDHRYQLSGKPGLDFYSLAHDYYIRLLSHHFRPLLDKPADVPLSTWMARGFHFVVLDALKAYNKEFGCRADETADAVLQYVQTAPEGNPLLRYLSGCVAAHYADPQMGQLAEKVLLEGYKQKEVAEQMGLTPAAINKRWQKLMNEVVVPEVLNGGWADMFDSVCCRLSRPLFSKGLSFCRQEITGEGDSIPAPAVPLRVTPDRLEQISGTDILVFGSNQQGIHAGRIAREALERFGAQMHQGAGIQGQSYAIPVMKGDVDTIQPYVDEFLGYASRHPHQHFMVTEVGCTLAGFEPEDIAPLFAPAREESNIWLPISFLVAMEE